MKSKKAQGLKIAIGMLAIIMIYLIIPNKTQGALQANGDTAKKDTMNNWMINIRNMQASGGALGLTDTINSNLTSENKDLDIHMEKNTEYGAMIILSASSYGKPDKINDGETTTGNATGVVIKLNNDYGEMVVAGGSSVGNLVSNFNNALGRYKNIYGSHVGDAMTETNGWHGSGRCSWLYRNTYIFTRATYKGSVFGYVGDWNQGHNNAVATRAVVVVGSGI